MLLLSTFFGTSLLSQNPKGNGPHPNKNTKLSNEERIKKETEKATIQLALSADQKIKWETASRERILANSPYKEKLEGSTTPEERKLVRAQMELNAIKFDTSVSAFLSDDQKVKYEAFKKERKNKQKHPNKGMQ